MCNNCNGQGYANNPNTHMYSICTVCGGKGTL